MTKRDDVVQIGRRITEARLAKAWQRGVDFPQSELAELVGVQPPTIGRYERGEKRPDGPMIMKLAHALDADAGWLEFGPPKAGLYAGRPTTATAEIERPASRRRGRQATRSKHVLPPMHYGENAFTWQHRREAVLRERA